MEPAKRATLFLEARQCSDSFLALQGGRIDRGNVLALEDFLFALQKTFELHEQRGFFAEQAAQGVPTNALVHGLLTRLFRVRKLAERLLHAQQIVGDALGVDGIAAILESAADLRDPCFVHGRQIANSLLERRQSVGGIGDMYVAGTRRGRLVRGCAGHGIGSPG